MPDKADGTGFDLLLVVLLFSLKKTVAGFTTTGFYFFKTEIVFFSNLVLMTLFSFLVLLHFVSKSTKPKVAGFYRSSPSAP